MYTKIVIICTYFGRRLVPLGFLAIGRTSYEFSATQYAKETDYSALQLWYPASRVSIIRLVVPDKRNVAVAADTRRK